MLAVSTMAVFVGGLGVKAVKGWFHDVDFNDRNGPGKFHGAVGLLSTWHLSIAWRFSTTWNPLFCLSHGAEKVNFLHKLEYNENTLCKIKILCAKCFGITLSIVKFIYYRLLFFIVYHNWWNKGDYNVITLCQVGGRQPEARLQRATRAVQRSFSVFLRHCLIYQAGFREHSNGSCWLPEWSVDSLWWHHQQIQRLQGPRLSFLSNSAKQ